MKSFNNKLSEEISESSIDFIMVVILLLAGFKLTFGLGEVRDVALYDESIALFNGVNLFSKGLPPASDSPLYVCWYYALSFIQPDMIKLFYLNQELLTSALPILLYVLLRRYELPIIPSLLSALYFLICRINFDSEIKSAHLALVIVLLCFIITARMRKTTTSLIVLALGAILLSYVRPEFILSFFLLGLLWLMKTVKSTQRTEVSRVVLEGIALIVPSIILIFIFGFVLDGENRSFFAFGQHFSINWVRWTNSFLDPSKDWSEIMKSSFGSVTTISGALISNPSIFLKHLLYNVARYSGKFLWLAGYHYNIIFPVNSVFNVIEAVLLLVATLMWGAFRWKQRLDRALNNYSLREILFQYGCFLFPSVLVAILIYPRNHYIVFPIGLLPVLLLLIMCDSQVPRKKVTIKQLAAMAIIVLGFTPSLGSQTQGLTGYSAWLTFNQTSKLENLKTIKFIRSFAIKEEVNLLEAEGGFPLYLGENFHRVPEDSKQTDFARFLTEKKINIIVVSEALTIDRRFVQDEQWESFLSNYRASGFQMFKIPSTDRVLFVKENLLQYHR